MDAGKTLASMNPTAFQPSFVSPAWSYVLALMTSSFLTHGELLKLRGMESQDNRTYAAD
jgi:hypothetical protein